MIIRRVGDTLLLVTQHDHSRLAGRIMTAWRAEGFRERSTRARVLMATSEHDLGWQSVDSAPSVHPDTGAPYEFVNAPLDVRQGVWPRALDRLAPQDPYAAALVAHHAATVYRRYAAAPEWAAFFPAMERRRNELLATHSSSFEAFLQDYAIVGMGDLWSLVFCNGWREPHSMGAYRALLHDRATSHDSTDDTVPGGWLEITSDLKPAEDPFNGEIVPFEVAARRVPARRYASDADLRDTLARAPVVQLTGIAAGAPPAS